MTNGVLTGLFPLDIPIGRDTKSEWLLLTSVTSCGIPVDDLTRLVGVQVNGQYDISRILDFVPSSVSMGVCDGQVYDFLSKDRAQA